MSSDLSLPAFIQALPKTETHLHFEGTLPFELLQKVRPDFTEPPESWAPDFKFRDFAHFERELLELMDLKYADLLGSISGTKDLGTDIAQRLKDVLRQFTDSFKAAIKA